MNRILASTSALAMFAMSPQIMFAAAEKAGAGSPSPVASPVPSPVPSPNGDPSVSPVNGSAPTATPAKATKAKPEITAKRAGVPLPTKRLSGGRGGKTIYDFEGLEIGDSFGVKNKTVKSMASTVSAANDRYSVVTMGADGKPVMIPDPKDPTKQIEHKVPTRKFISGEVDPKDDPDGASVRVWRVALDYVAP